jgi:hypothetical protein
MSSPWFDVQRCRPWRRLAQQLHFITAIEPLYCFRNSQRNFGVAAAFAALSAAKMYVHAHDDQRFESLVKKSVIVSVACKAPAGPGASMGDSTGAAWAPAATAQLAATAMIRSFMR